MQNAFEHLNERLENAIRHNPHFDGRRLRFEASEGKVVLKGTVGSYFEKQMAQESLRRVEGVQEIENDLEVTW